MAAMETHKRMLIGEWEPPNTTKVSVEMRSVEPVSDPTAERPQIRLFRDGESIVTEGGVSYQHCGGGRRVIRKRIGGS